jgi:ribosomal protein S18 acetylase RimI-like enzyme
MVEIARLTHVTESALPDFDALMKELKRDPSDVKPIALPNVEEMLTSPGTTLLVAKDGERIVGMATLSLYPKLEKRAGTVDDVVVLAEYRGQGIGEKLMRAVLEEAKAQGAASLYLTSHASRAAAHKLYEKVGFKKYETDVFKLAL